MDYDKIDMDNVYDAGRSYSPAVLEQWLEVISRDLSAETIADIVDIGKI
jgi:hypothetical protein